MSTFTAPATGGDTLKPADVLGHALIIRPSEIVCDIETTFGPTDAVRVNVADLTTGELHTDVLWFPKGLLAALRSKLGANVLAQMAQGTAKPGQSPPWTLADLSTDAATVAHAEKWLAANPGKLEGAPAPVVTSPAGSPALAPF
jgi:hypothetical protein